MSEVDDAIDDFSEAFDDMREDLLPDGVRCFLIKRKVNSGQKEDVREMTAGWFQQWSAWREQTEFDFAVSGQEFADQVSQTSFIAYGVPDGNDEIDIYAIAEPSRDKVPPDLVSAPYWRLFTSRVDNERFTIPQEIIMPVEIYDIEIIRGFTFSRAFTLSNPDGTAIDLTGRSVGFHLQQGESLLEFSSGDAPTAAGSLIEITDANAGQFSLLLTNEETNALTDTDGRWWLTITGPSEVSDIAGRLDPLLKGAVKITRIDE